VACAHVGFRGLYGVLSIPYATLFARVTRSSTERGDMAGMRMFFATCSAVAVAAGTQPLVRFFGMAGDPSSGWLMAGVLYAVFATLLMWLAAWGAKGLDRADDEPAPRLPLKEAVSLVARNQALMIMLVAVVVSSFTGTMFGKNVLYYFKYVLLREDAIGMALGLGALLSAVAVPPWVLIMRRIDKKATWMAGSFFVVVGFVLWRAVDGMGLAAHLVSVAIQAFGGAGVAVSMWAMLPDTVEYGEWRNGRRIESFAFGLAVFFQKLALGLGAGAVGLALGWIGYRANEVQPPEVLESLKNLMFWLPLAGKLAAIAVMSRYPMGRGDHERIRRELDARAAA
jgi:GPH family glycoside/pentoside/hexuronide:cation symporter